MKKPPKTAKNSIALGSASQQEGTLSQDVVLLLLLPPPQTKESGIERLGRKKQCSLARFSFPLLARATARIGRDAKGDERERGEGGGGGCVGGSGAEEGGSQLRDGEKERERGAKTRCLLEAGGPAGSRRTRAKRNVWKRVPARLHTVRHPARVKAAHCSAVRELLTSTETLLRVEYRRRAAAAACRVVYSGCTDVASSTLARLYGHRFWRNRHSAIEFPTCVCYFCLHFSYAFRWPREEVFSLSLLFSPFYGQ